MTVESGSEEVVKGSTDGVQSLEKAIVESTKEIEKLGSKLEEVGYRSREGLVKMGE